MIAYTNEWKFYDVAVQCHFRNSNNIKEEKHSSQETFQGDEDLKKKH